MVNYLGRLMEIWHNLVLQRTRNPSSRRMAVCGFKSRYLLGHNQERVRGVKSPFLSSFYFYKYQEISANVRQTGTKTGTQKYKLIPLWRPLCRLFFFLNRNKNHLYLSLVIVTSQNSTAIPVKRIFVFYISTLTVYFDKIDIDTLAGWKRWGWYGW